MIYTGSDHAGYPLKLILLDSLAKWGVEYDDLGCYSPEKADYTEFATLVCGKITPERRGILVCGTGLGMSIMANRRKGIRAALCHDVFSAKMARAHNDANVLCLGARVIGPGAALEILRAWLDTPFEGGRHAERIARFDMGI